MKYGTGNLLVEFFAANVWVAFDFQGATSSYILVHELKLNENQTHVHKYNKHEVLEDS